MSLFADLPPPTAHLRPKPQTQEDQQPMPQQQEVEEPDEQDTSSEEPDYDEREQQERSSAEPESEGAEDPPTKRVKFASDAADHDGPSTSGQALPEGQVLMALKKIRSHIGNASKFSKASQLLRQLFDTKAITRACRDEAFLAVRAAFPTFTAPFQLDVQRDYMRLCHCIDKHQGALSKPQRAHFAIYYIVGKSATKGKEHCGTCLCEHSFVYMCAATVSNTCKVTGACIFLHLCSGMRMHALQRK